LFILTQYIVDALVKDGRSEAVEHFVKCTRNVFACDRFFMYNLLINLHKENADKLGDIWLMMQEEDFIPSNAMKIKIARTLEKKGKQV